jgi:signal transduction histidine kinase
VHPGSAEVAQTRDTGRERTERGVTPLLILVALVLTALSAVSFFFPGFSYLIIAPRVELVIDTAALVIAGSIAVRTWLRFGETGEPDSLFQAAAFLTIVVGALLKLGPMLLGSALHAPYELDTPGQQPLYIWTMQRLAAGVLLLLGSVAALGWWRMPVDGRAAMVVAGPALAVGAIGLLILAAPIELPALIPPELLIRSLQPGQAVGFELLASPMALAQLAIGMVYLAAAIGYARLADRLAGRGRAREYTTLLAVALVVAAFTQLHYAVVPGTYTGVVTGGEALRLLFYVLILAGVALASRRDLIDLARANRSLASLRELDRDRVALEERARLAREIHDGLVQELWLARLAHGQLRQVEQLPKEAHTLVDRVDSALEAALSEARQAVIVLHASPDTSMGSLLREVIEDFADRFGLEVECMIESEPTRLPEKSVGEVLRICREALNNVRKHADATLTRVTLTAESDSVILSIFDNGRGFESAGVKQGYGMKSMRDRAASIGAQLEVVSAPMDGTRVALVLQLPSEEGAT